MTNENYHDQNILIYDRTISIYVSFNTKKKGSLQVRNHSCQRKWSEMKIRTAQKPSVCKCRHDISHTYSLHASQENKTKQNKKVWAYFKTGWRKLSSQIRNGLSLFTWKHVLIRIASAVNLSASLVFSVPKEQKQRHNACRCIFLQNYMNRAVPSSEMDYMSATGCRMSNCVCLF